MADFIGKRHFKKNNIPEGAFVIFNDGEFYSGCSLADSSGIHQQWPVENGILKLKALLGSPYTEYRLIVNQSPESGTGKTPNIFGVDIASPVPDIIDSQGLTLYGANKSFNLTPPWNEKKVYRYNVSECGETSFKLTISLNVASGQSATAGQTLLAIRSMWYE